jgi:hypothetical protein
MTPIQPPACIVMGPTGTGKTDVILTLLTAGLEVFVIITEPDGIVSLIDGAIRRKLPLDNLHWSYCPPAAVGVMPVIEMATKIGSMGFQAIQDLKDGIGKSDATREAAMKILRLIANFHCDRTGADFGPVAKWGDNRALVIDSLSGFSIIAWMLTLGLKPTGHPGEWNVAQNFIRSVLNQITGDRHFFFVMIAHIERETDDLTGTTKTMVSTLGRKLAPNIPLFFSEVILARKTITGADKVRFHWSTIDSQCDLKNRSLPIGSDLEPDFRPIVDAYHKRLKYIQESIPAPEQPTPSTPTSKVTPLPSTLTKRT